MNEIKVFENSEFGKVRTIVINNEPYFVGKDVAEALGYSNSKDALIKHVDEEDKRLLKSSDLRPLENHISKSVLRVDFVSSEIPNRGLTIINESGVYSLVFSSKLPQAKKFKHWVMSEILPSFRKPNGEKLLPLESVKEPLIVQNTSQIVFNLSDVDIFEEKGNLWFRIADVAKCIDYTSPDHWNRWFDDDEIVFRQISGIDKPMKYMSESALYRVLTKSNVSKAKPFERWITKEVIPSIRKTGSYSMKKSNEDLMAIVVQTNNQIANICASLNEQLKITTNQTQENTARIEKLEKQFEEKTANIASDLPPKEHVIALIRNHADKTGSDYGKLYRQLYSDYELRTHTKPSVKAKKANMTTIAFIEKEGDIELLLSIAEKLFGIGA